MGDGKLIHEARKWGIFRGRKLVAGNPRPRGRADCRLPTAAGLADIWAGDGGGGMRRQKGPVAGAKWGLN